MVAQGGISVLDDTQQVTGQDPEQALVWVVTETGNLQRLPSNQAIALSLGLCFLHVVVHSLANNGILFGYVGELFLFLCWSCHIELIFQVPEL